MNKSKVLLAEMDNVRAIKPGDILFRLDAVGEAYFSGLVLKTLNHEEEFSIISFLVLHRRILPAHENTIKILSIPYDGNKIEILSGGFNG